MVIFLLSMYGAEILLMMFCMAYVFILFVQKINVFNSHLKGRRLKAAALLPILWFVHVYTEAYTVYCAGEDLDWNLHDSAIQIKIVMQLISLAGGGLLAAFVMGYDFGEKEQ